MRTTGVLIGSYVSKAGAIRGRRANMWQKTPVFAGKRASAGQKARSGVDSGGRQEPTQMSVAAAGMTFL